MKKSNQEIQRKYYELLQKSIAEPDVAFDLGPGLPPSTRGSGLTEAWAFSEIWPKSQIIGAEPSFTRFNQLKKARYPGTLLNSAVGEYVGEYRGFMVDKGMFQASRVKETNEEIVVQQTTVDQMDKDYGPFKKIFIWADVEGSELRVLQGAQECLSSKRIAGFNLELWPANHKKNMA